MNKFRLITVLALILSAGLVAGCEPLHSFEEGQCVQMKMDGLKGTVITSARRNIWVRFAVRSEKTNTHLLGSDDDIEAAPYRIIMVKYFELQRCN